MFDSCMCVCVCVMIDRGGAYIRAAAAAAAAAAAVAAAVVVKGIEKHVDVDTSKHPPTHSQPAKKKGGGTTHTEREMKEWKGE